MCAPESQCTSPRVAAARAQSLGKALEQLLANAEDRGRGDASTVMDVSRGASTSASSRVMDFDGARSDDDAPCEPGSESLELFRSNYRCTPVRLLGTGATCHVELVLVPLPYDDGTHLPCARKVIPRSADPHLRAADDALYAREQEGLRAGSASPFFLRQLGSAVHNDRLELLLEWAEGDTLEHELTNALGAISGDIQATLLPCQRIAEVTAAVFSALADLHAAGYAHLDVKPSNVFLTSEKRVLLGDAGCSGRVEEVAAATGPRAGSPLYLPPEAKPRRGAPAQPFSPQAADVYAMGVTLAVCAAFHRQTGRVLAWQRGDAALPAFVPPALADLVARCTAADPAARPTAAEALAHPFLAGVDRAALEPRRVAGAAPR